MLDSEARSRECDYELLRRFGVSGRKRSYQTLLVAARSSRRPFSLYFSVLHAPVRRNPSLELNSSTQPDWSMNRLSASAIERIGAKGFGNLASDRAKMQPT